MSRGRRGAALMGVGLGTLLLVSGCATRGALQRGLEEQRAALEAERAERMAADQRVVSDVQQVAGNVERLRVDLASMDTEFGTKLTQLEESLQLAVPVHFAFDRADVRQEAEPILDRFAAIVQRNYPDAVITVEGFADPAGPAEYNRRLALQRAEAVRMELVRRGLPEGQLRAIGYGEERPVIPNAAGNQTGAELNRRVVFVIETPTERVLGTPTASR